MYNLIEYNGNYMKTPGSLWQYCRDEPDDDDRTDSKSLTCKSRITNNTGNADTVNVEIVVPLKYFSNFWRTLEMPLINCEISFDKTRSASCVTYDADRVTTVTVTDAKLYASVVSLSIQDNAKLFQQLNQVLGQRLFGININQKYQHNHKIHI